MTKLIEGYTIKDIAASFQRDYYEACVNNNLTAIKGRQTIVKVINYYFSIVVEDILTKAHVVEMGYGLGFMYLGSRKAPPNGIYPRFQYSNKQQLPKIRDFVVRPTKVFFDATSYYYFKLRWKKSKLRNINSYNMQTAYKFRHKIAKHVEDQTLTHY